MPVDLRPGDMLKSARGPHDRRRYELVFLVKELPTTLFDGRTFLGVCSDGTVDSYNYVTGVSAPTRAILGPRPT